MIKSPPPNRSTAGLAVLPDRVTHTPSDRFPHADRLAVRAQPLMRRYEVLYLKPNGVCDDLAALAPAIPAFEDSFSALARGALLATERGTVAVEDIVPGDKIKTVANGFQTLQWRGSMTVVPPPIGQQTLNHKLIRVSADALGIARPMMDLLLGPAARLFHRLPTLKRATGHGAAFVPARDFVDGVNIIEVSPPTSVQVFQLGFTNHERISANGVEIDSHNPGARHELNLRGDMLEKYMSLFPHVNRIEDFGMLAHPRLSLRDLDFDSVA